MEAQVAPPAPPCVVLYGNSVFLAGIRAELEARAHLDLLTLEAANPDAEAVIRERRPAAVLFDLDSAPADLALALLRERPGHILIGVDPSSDTLLVLSSRHEQPVSAAGLVQALVAAPVSAAPSQSAAPQSRSDAPR